MISNANINLHFREPGPEEPQLNILLTTDDDDERPVYLSGNFNEWHTQDRKFEMDKVGNGLYHFRFPEDFVYPNELLYKFTKGDWSAVEIDQSGNRTENRSCTQTQGLRREHVAKWRRNWLPFKPNFLPQIQLISEGFDMPQLNRKRRIWALLPHDYDSSGERYPVMYLQDAQNLFNEQAQYGNWEIDKKLAVMSEYKIGKIIIIAIEHAEQDRIKEYNVGRTVLGAGEGKKYIRFITDTLKPFVDGKFRTKPEREHTGIGGSSMGGLVSIFSGLMYPEVYGKLMIFSPSLWVVPKMDFMNMNLDEPGDTKIYLYAGGDESKTMIGQVKKFKDNMIKNGFVADKMKIRLSINMEGQHNERYWSDEFPKAMEWLFFNTKDN
ncbi:carbohydrate esterase [Flavobacterium magnum]|uniref:Carbohydrate esterase n=1 Tax=Flavobacterium magnum TaxID=2162713 RepID=A0A2S0RH61_9FLAO|nr:alpha/beta hydrolase-fold protein [Flavobacterium magnum]AWA30568.1 carbohydrate esterase [Flavobacterium magnum]